MFSLSAYIRQGFAKYTSAYILDSNIPNRAVGSDNYNYSLFVKSRLTNPRSFNHMAQIKLGNLKETLNKYIYNSDFSIIMVGLNEYPYSNTLGQLKYYSMDYHNRLSIFLYGTKFSNIDTIAREFNIKVDNNQIQDVTTLIIQLYLRYQQSTNDLFETAKILLEKVHGIYNYIIYDYMLDKMIVVKTVLPLAMDYVESNFIYLTYSDENVKQLPPNSVIVINPKSIRAEFEKVNIQTGHGILQLLNGSYASIVTPFIMHKLYNKDVVLYVADSTQNENGMSFVKLLKKLGRQIAKQLKLEIIIDDIIFNDMYLHSEFRDLIQCSYAANTAITHNIATLFIPNDITLSQVKKWQIDTFMEMNRSITGESLKIVNPTELLTETDLIDLGIIFGAPIDSAVFCSQPTVKETKSKRVFGSEFLPCGLCDGCLRRQIIHYNLHHIDSLTNKYLNKSKHIALQEVKTNLRKDGIVDIDAQYIDKVVKRVKPLIDNVLYRHGII